jgi:BlaI family penicillinase repressor
MESTKLFDSELKLMEMIWSNAPVSAKALASMAEAQIGWNKNTTYTILKKLVEKGAVKRQEPHFICTALIQKEQVQKTETRSLIDKLFSGSRKAFFAAFLEQEKLTDDELRVLISMIDKSEG